MSRMAMTCQDTTCVVTCGYSGVLRSDLRDLHGMQKSIVGGLRSPKGTARQPDFEGTVPRSAEPNQIG